MHIHSLRHGAGAPCLQPAGKAKKPYAPARPSQNAGQRNQKVRLGKILFFLWLFVLAQGAQAVAAPRENASWYDELVSATSFEYWDQDSQLLYLRARWYDPRIGRFISADPFEGKQHDPRSLNRYSYASNDSVNNSDPSGLDTLTGNMMATSVMGTLAQSAIVTTTALAGMYSVNQRIKNVVGSRAAAQQCARSFAAGLKSFGPGDCPGVRTPIVVMSEDRMPGIGEHVQIFQSMGSPALLDRTVIDKIPNRVAALVKCYLAGQTIQVAQGGKSCDEYPFASTLQGGAPATIAKVPLRSNLVQGGSCRSSIKHV
jgi:RHS repeat-associated protein